MKKILFVILILVIFPINSWAYSFVGNNIDKSVYERLTSMANDWPSGLDDGRVQVVIEAAKMINKGIVYGGGYRNCSDTVKPPELDCSAYVSLAYYRAGVRNICGWSTANFSLSSDFTEISETELRPGDIGLNIKSDCTGPCNHVGIYVGKENGVNIWFHSSSYNGVSGPQIRVGNNNFKYFARYNKWNEVQVNSSSNNDNQEIGGELGGLLEDKYSNGISDINGGETTCETVFYNSDGSEKTIKVLLDGIFSLIKIASPIIMIVVTIISYIKVLVNSDELKKVNKKTVKRLIITIVIVMLPYLLELLFQIFGLYDLSNCGIS